MLITNNSNFISHSVLTRMNKECNHNKPKLIVETQYAAGVPPACQQLICVVFISLNNEKTLQPGLHGMNHKEQITKCDINRAIR